MPPQLAAIRPTTLHRHLTELEVHAAACARDAVEDVITHDIVTIAIPHPDAFGTPQIATSVDAFAPLFG